VTATPPSTAASATREQNEESKLARAQANDLRALGFLLHDMASDVPWHEVAGTGQAKRHEEGTTRPDDGAWGLAAMSRSPLDALTTLPNEGLAALIKSLIAQSEPEKIAVEGVAEARASTVPPPLLSATDVLKRVQELARCGN
jgi:hypothetical protein